MGNRRGVSGGELLIWIFKFFAVSIVVILLVSILYKFGKLPEETAKQDYLRFKEVLLNAEQCSRTKESAIDAARITDTILRNCYQLPKRAFFVTLEYQGKIIKATTGTDDEKTKEQICNSVIDLTCESFQEYITVKTKEGTYVPGKLTIEVMRHV